MDSLKHELTNNDGIEKVIDGLKAPSNDILCQNNISAQGKPLSMFGNNNNGQPPNQINSKNPSRTQEGFDKTASNVNALEIAGTSPQALVGGSNILSVTPHEKTMNENKQKIEPPPSPKF
jgi:hypothetical protein